MTLGSSSGLRHIPCDRHRVQGEGFLPPQTVIPICRTLSPSASAVLALSS